MRSTAFAAITAMACTIAGCGAEPPAPQPPPPPPVPAASVAVAPTASTPPPAPKPSLDELIPQTLKGIGAAFNAHDAKKVASYYTEDAVVSAYGSPDSHGRDDLAAAMDSIFKSFSDAKSAPLRAWAKGNVVVAETVWVGTMTSDFMGHKATEKPVGQLRANVLWFNDDGLVKEMHEYGDSVGLMAQIEGKKNAPPVPVLPANLPEVH
ncbi:MAG: ester cyclase, partial [Polyangiaceae bacterium]